MNAERRARAGWVSELVKMFARRSIRGDLGRIVGRDEGSTWRGLAPYGPDRPCLRRWPSCVEGRFPGILHGFPAAVKRLARTAGEDDTTEFRKSRTGTHPCRRP